MAASQQPRVERVESARWGHEDWQQKLMEVATSIIPENFTGEIVLNASAGIVVNLELGKVRVNRK